MTLSGLSTLDRRRLNVDPPAPPHDVGPTAQLGFLILQRMSLSGPGAVLVEWTESDGLPGGGLRRAQRLPVVSRS